jgi:glucoamylase
LTGERAHYELAAGRRAEAVRLLHALEAFANDGGLIPEQVWDAEDIPKKELYYGRPSGSAMPLVWAHAEYVKLRRSLRDGVVFDMPAQTVQRYLKHRTGSPRAIWRFNHKCQTMPVGKTLRVEVRDAAIIHWSSDGWQTSHDAKTKDTGLGIHLVDLPTDDLSAGRGLTFTLYWPTEDRWEGTNFEVRIES